VQHPLNKTSPLNFLPASPQALQLGLSILDCPEVALHLALSPDNLQRPLFHTNESTLEEFTMGKVISTVSQLIAHAHGRSTRSNKKMRKAINTLKEKHLSVPHEIMMINFDRSSLTPTLPVSVTIPVPVHSERPAHFVLPDLVSHCKFELTYHPNGDEIAQQSVDWLDFGCPDLNPKQRKALRGLQAGELTAFCYNTCPPERLRVVSDFMNYLFHL
jgi:hypothetical protein